MNAADNLRDYIIHELKLAAQLDAFESTGWRLLAELEVAKDRSITVNTAVHGLRGVCQTCKGTRQMQKLGGTYRCPDCNPAVDDNDIEERLAVVKAELAAEKAAHTITRQSAITGWESARILAIAPPRFGAPATEAAADEALAKLRRG